MAIIDILTPYDAKKKAAHAAKTVKHGVSSPCLQPGPVGGPSDSQASCFRETLPLPLSQGGEQEERPAWLPGVHSLPPYSIFWLIRQLVFPFVLWPLGLRAHWRLFRGLLGMWWFLGMWWLDASNSFVYMSTLRPRGPFPHRLQATLLQTTAPTEIRVSLLPPHHLPPLVGASLGLGLRGGGQGN